MNLNLPQLENIPEDAILNRFITKTCLTTYTYLTTYKHNGSTTIESREKVISNIATEERNTQNLTPLIASDMTFFKVFPSFRIEFQIFQPKLFFSDAESEGWPIQHNLHLLQHDHGR